MNHLKLMYSKCSFVQGQPARAGPRDLKKTHLKTKSTVQYARYEPLGADVSDHLCRDNLHVLDHVTLMYVSGNLVHFLNTETRQMTYLRYIAQCA